MATFSFGRKTLFGLKSFGAFYAAGALITGTLVSATTVPSMLAYPDAARIGPVTAAYHIADSAAADAFARQSPLQRLASHETLWLADAAVFWPWHLRSLGREYRDPVHRRLMLACDLIPSKLSALEILY